MKLLTESIENKLKANWKKSLMEEEELPVKPVVKFFNPAGAGTWLIADIDDEGRMFGLCDLGVGCPELGYVSIQELESVDVGFGLKIERDIHWEADKTLQEYAIDANEDGYINA